MHVVESAWNSEALGDVAKILLGARGEFHCLPRGKFVGLFEGLAGPSSGIQVGCLALAAKQVKRNHGKLAACSAL